jgi:DNA (cytosine-5)-methyltransferase 1
VAYRLGTGLERHAWHEDRGDEPGRQCQNALRSAAEGGVACRLADSNGDRRDERQPGDGGGEEGEGRAHRDGVAGCGELGGTGTIDSPWREADWLFCRDGKWRPVEPGTFPLAARTSTRVGRLRGYGNAIVPRLAAEFILSTIEALRDSGAEQPKRT